MHISRKLEGNELCTCVKPANLCGLGSRNDIKTAREGTRLWTTWFSKISDEAQSVNRGKIFSV